MSEFFKNKRILITGGTGSIGSEIVRKLLQHEPRVVRVLSNDENGLFNLEKELQGGLKLRFLIGDVKDKQRLQMAIENVDFVFHAAALKHVPLCEYNPFEAVQTNVLGTENIIEAALGEDVEKLITISTDKAVNPINVMGATKLLAERLTTSVNYHKGLKRTIFSCVRFGNVLDSRGSVLPLFRKQIEQGGPVMITDPNMTRFVMSISRAVELVLKAAEMAEGGEVFIFKMPVVRIGDLAEAMIEELAPKYGHDPTKIPIEIINARAGEKIYEELMTEEELKKASEIDDMFVIWPSITEEQIRVRKVARRNYASKEQNLLTKEELKALLRATPQVNVNV